MEKPQLTDEEKKVLDEARSIRRKARGNNGAKRDIHEECEVEYKDVYPDDPFFDKLKAHPLEKMKGDGMPDYQTCTRYVYVPGHFKNLNRRKQLDGGGQLQMATTIRPRHIGRDKGQAR